MKNAGTVLIFAGVGLFMFNTLIGAGLVLFGIVAIVLDVFGGKR